LQQDHLEQRAIRRAHRFERPEVSQIIECKVIESLARDLTDANNDRSIIVQLHLVPDTEWNAAAIRQYFCEFPLCSDYIHDHCSISLA